MLKFTFYEYISKEVLNKINNLLILCDKEFIPSLSTRNSTTQKDFSLKNNSSLDLYLKGISEQSAFVAFEDNVLVGFMSFRENYYNDIILDKSTPNIYISTIIVEPNYRRQGITIKFYELLLNKYSNRNIYTRTWSTNIKHINILHNIGFKECFIIKDDREVGVDTVYFELVAEEKCDCII